MPEAGEEHDYDEVERRPFGAEPGAAERDEQVVTDPARERDVPAPKSEMFSALNGELKFCGKRKPISKASPTAMSE